MNRKRQSPASASPAQEVLHSPIIAILLNIALPLAQEEMKNSAHHSPIHLCWGGPWPSLYKVLPCFVIE